MKTTRRNCLKTGLAGAGLLVAGRRSYAQGSCCEELDFQEGKTFELVSSIPVPPDELRMLGGYVHNHKPLVGEMAQSGGWTAVFDILGFSATAGYRKKNSDAADMSNRLMGQVAVSRLRNQTEYQVQMDFRPTRAAEHVTATIRCNDDELFSIRNYELVWTCQSIPDVSYTRREAGRVASGKLQVAFESFSDSFALSNPLSCLWTMIDAVRLLPADSAKSYETDFFMDLTSMKYRQQLQYSGRKEVCAADGTIPLHFFRQIGPGIEPIHYAVDEQKRPLFITQGQLGWGLNRIEII